ncbi:MAG: putative nucleotidyltransferase substrate binding domain-containing protein [bacterium]
MEIELLEIRDFLAAHLPFGLLPEVALDALPAQLKIRYVRRGGAFPPEQPDGPVLLVIRSGAVDLRTPGGDLLERLADGDSYSDHCALFSMDKTELSGEAAEDTLLYCVPCKLVLEYRNEHHAFNEYFTHDLRERIQQAAEQARLDASGQVSLGVSVAELLRREPLVMDAANSIRDAAELMSGQHISALMIEQDGRLVGIVTDRDLRDRCIAAGLSWDSAVTEIMSGNISTVDSHTPLSDALMIMTREQVHHLPVVDSGQVRGMLTAGDLTRYQSTNAAFLSKDIQRAASVDELVQISQMLPAYHLQLVNAGNSALHVGEAVSRITDALTTRLIELAIDQLGEAPVPFVWLAGGSQARFEQTSHSDQDNALLLDDQFDAGQHGDYFSSLSKFVNDGLNACGFEYCPGDAMACNPQWRQPLKQWQKYFRKWIEQPEPKSLMLSSIFFDLRPVYGSVLLYRQLHEDILSNTQKNGIFLAYMAANALQHRPPLGLFRNFVLVHDGEHDDTLDIKRRGIAPITDIARLVALAEGIEAVNSTERLQEAAGTPSLSTEMSANLIDALEYIASLRMRHQARQIHTGIDPDNYLQPESLSGLERAHLKDAFRLVQEMQETLSHRYQAGRLR